MIGVINKGSTDFRSHGQVPKVIGMFQFERWAGVTQTIRIRVLVL